MRTLLAATVIFFTVCLSGSSSASAEVRGFKKPEQKVALVIGNSTYAHAPLANPTNDAELVARVLTDAGFNVTLARNVDRKKLKVLSREFGARLKDGAVAVFYYSGHGLQVQGRNYLVPVDADITSEVEVDAEAIDLANVLAAFDQAENTTNIVILDACRNNPFARSFRTLSPGLAVTDAPAGTLLAYATAPGSVAADGTGKNSAYSGALAEEMRAPGVRVETVFKRVRARVKEESKGAQIPWESSSLIGDFSFFPAVDGSSLVEEPKAPPMVDEPKRRPRVSQRSISPKQTDELKTAGYWTCGAIGAVVAIVAAVALGGVGCVGSAIVGVCGLYVGAWALVYGAFCCQSAAVSSSGAVPVVGAAALLSSSALTSSTAVESMMALGLGGLAASSISALTAGAVGTALVREEMPFRSSKRDDDDTSQEY